MELLGWIGRQRTRAISALVLIAILVPPLGAVTKPYVTEAVTGLLCIAFLRIDINAFRSYLQKPQLVIAAAVWTTFAIPILFAIGTSLFGVIDTSPALFQGLILQAVASPIMSAPAFAALMGLDATLVLVSLVLSSALTPLSAMLFAALLSLELPLSPTDLGVNLLTILVGSAIIGLLLRKVIGAERIAHYRDEIDGINIIILLALITAMMGEFGETFLNRPVLMFGLIVLAFVVFGLLLTVTYAIFLATGAKQAFAIGMMTSQRNMGLMLAGTSGTVPELTWLYFAVGQFPIFLSPLMLQPVARLIDRKNAD